MSAVEKDAWRITFSEVKAAAEDIIEEARKGRMFILVDDEDRENEGDLVIPAQWATPETINFMAKHARGLICLALTRERVEQLGLALMAQNNGTRHQTAFTVSIEAREGVTTGISASDRARTVAVAIDPEKEAKDIITPGHIFPLMARDGGVLVRAGHTEAAVDIARLAGLNPSGDIWGPDPVLGRRRALNVLDDVLGDTSVGRGGILHSAMKMIGQVGRGVVVLVREPRPTSLSDRVRARQPDPGSLAGALGEFLS